MKTDEDLEFIKAFSKISVQDICKKKNINRSNLLNGRASKINSKKVMNVKDVMNILKDINPGDGTYFFVNRDGDTLILMM